MCNYVKDHHDIHKDKHAIAKSKTLTLDCILNDVDELPESTLGERIKKLRLQNDLNIKQLANLSNVSEETISKIEKSKTIPNISTVNKISQAFSIGNAYLFDMLPETNSSEIIYKYRLISGMTQRQLAAKCNLHESTIRDYEEGNLRNKDTLEFIYKSIGYI